MGIYRKLCDILIILCMKRRIFHIRIRVPGAEMNI